MIKIENLTHIYENSTEGEAIKDINLHIKRGENVAIIGSSGSGKSTLLKCLNRLIEPTSGSILIEEEDIVNCSKKEAERIRGKIGMIFQNFNLLERESVFNNVLNGRLRYNKSWSTVFKRFSEEDYRVVNENIVKMGLLVYRKKKVADLSGGQKQRVAIARALSQKPSVMLADEPVSNLDPKLMMEIMDLLKSICEEKGITLITSLHFIDFAKRYCSRVIGMKNGRIVFDGKFDRLTKKKLSEIYGESNDWHLHLKEGMS